jgi:hypothetical protein
MGCEDTPGFCLQFMAPGGPVVGQSLSLGVQQGPSNQFVELNSTAPG